MIYGVTPWHSNNLVELMAKLESKVNIQFNLISILFIYKKAINLPNITKDIGLNKGTY
jgi:hypothetical protein